MSPRPIVIDGESPFNDFDKWIQESSNGNPLSWFFRNAIKDLKIDENTYLNMLDRFIQDPLHGIGQCSQERSTFRGNTTKDIRNNSPSWNKFLFLMKVIGFKDIHMWITVSTESGRIFRDGVYVPLEGINVIGDDRQIDPRNLPSQRLSHRENRKLLKDNILDSDTKYVDLSLDEMTFLIRSTLSSANVRLRDWNDLMNDYVKHLDRAKRCTERNNFASQVLLSQTSSWKTYIKFLRFIKAKAIKIEIECNHVDEGYKRYQLATPINRSE